MRITPIIISFIILLSNCSRKDDCNNRFEFISTDDSIPILNLDINKHHDTIRKEMCDLYGFDLCELCTWAEFKIPFQIENKDGFLKVMTDFENPYCENCPVPVRDRDYYTILIRNDNIIAVHDRPVRIDSLQADINNYLSKVGIEEMAPENFRKVNFKLIWDKESNQNFLDTVLTKIYKAHQNFVEDQVEMSGLDFCKLKKFKIIELKKKYPLRIEFDLGKNAKFSPIFDAELENIEIIKDFEFKEKL